MPDAGPAAKVYTFTTRAAEWLQKTFVKEQIFSVLRQPQARFAADCVQRLRNKKSGIYVFSCPKDAKRSFCLQVTFRVTDGSEKAGVGVGHAFRKKPVSSKCASFTEVTIYSPSGDVKGYLVEFAKTLVLQPSFFGKMVKPLINVVGAAGGLSCLYLKRDALQQGFFSSANAEIEALSGNKGRGEEFSSDQKPGASKIPQELQVQTDREKLLQEREGRYSPEQLAEIEREKEAMRRNAQPHGNSVDPVAAKARCQNDFDQNSQPGAQDVVFRVAQELRKRYGNNKNIFITDTRQFAGNIPGFVDDLLALDPAYMPPEQISVLVMGTSDFLGTIAGFCRVQRSYTSVRGQLDIERYSIDLLLTDVFNQRVKDRQALGWKVILVNDGQGIQEANFFLDQHFENTLYLDGTSIDAPGVELFMQSAYEGLERRLGVKLQDAAEECCVCKCTRKEGATFEAIVGSCCCRVSKQAACADCLENCLKNPDNYGRVHCPWCRDKPLRVIQFRNVES